MTSPALTAGRRAVRLGRPGSPRSISPDGRSRADRSSTRCSASRCRSARWPLSRSSPRPSPSWLVGLAARRSARARRSGPGRALQRRPRPAVAARRAAPERRLLLLRLPALDRLRPGRRFHERLPDARPRRQDVSVRADEDRPRAVARGRSARRSSGRRSSPPATSSRPGFTRAGATSAPTARRIRTARPSASGACSTDCSDAGSPTGWRGSSFPRRSPRPP